MNIYFKKPPFVPHFGLFATKSTAISTKTQCNMPQNAVRFDAKCKVKWFKTQGKMAQNAVPNAPKCDTKSINIHCDCINKTLSSH